MMHLVDISLQIMAKQYNFQNKVRQSVSELLSTRDLIFVGKDILMICYPMDVQDYKLEYKVFIKILLEIQIEDIQ
jgi:hypothetical protein